MTQCRICDTRNSPEATQCVECGADLGQTATGGDQLQDLIDSGRKIEAIKLYLETYNTGLREAKEAVDAMMRGETPAPPTAPRGRANEQEIVTLLQEGGKIPAIKLYREQTGASLLEAKKAVEQLAADHGVEAAASGGCLGVILLFGLLTTITARYILA